MDKNRARKFWQAIGGGYVQYRTQKTWTVGEEKIRQISDIRRRPTAIHDVQESSVNASTVLIAALLLLPFVLVEGPRAHPSCGATACPGPIQPALLRLAPPAEEMQQPHLVGSTPTNAPNAQVQDTSLRLMMQSGTSRPGSTSQSRPAANVAANSAGDVDRNRALAPDSLKRRSTYSHCLKRRSLWM